MRDKPTHDFVIWSTGLATLALLSLGLRNELSTEPLKTAFLLVAVGLAASSFALLLWMLWREFAARTVSGAAIARIEDVFSGVVAIHGRYDEAPRLISKGPSSAQPEAMDAAQAEADALRKAGLDDESLAVVDRKDLVGLASHPSRSRQAPVASLHYSAVAYSRVLARRGVQQQMPPLVVSGIAVVADRNSDLLILQRRSSTSRTYPGLIGVVGGMMRKQGPRDYHVDSDVVHTLGRELREEVGEGNLVYRPPWIIVEDLRGGMLQIGPVVAEFAAHSNLKPSSSEGQLLEFDETLLRQNLSNPLDWTPGSLLRVVLWLEYGAPGVKWLSKRQARKLAGQTLEWVKDARSDLEGMTAFP